MLHSGAVHSHDSRLGCCVGIGMASTGVGVVVDRRGLPVDGAPTALATPIYPPYSNGPIYFDVAFIVLYFILIAIDFLI